MSVNPTGMVSLPLHYLRETIAATSAFQTWTGTANKAAALAYVPVLVDTVGDLPVCAVGWGEGLARSVVAGGTHSHFVQEGDLSMLFLGAISGDHDEADAAYTFLNSIGAILADMEELAGTAGYLDIRGFVLDLGPRRANEDEKKALRKAAGGLVGDYFQMGFAVEYGGI